MKQLLAIAIALVLAVQASAQIKTSTTEKLALLGVTSPVIQGNRILVGADSNVAVSPVVILQVETDYKFKRVKARRDGQRIEAEPLSETQYLFAGKGKYAVEITVFDPEKGIDETEITFEIDGKPDDGPDEPDGPNPPPPPPPSGPFDNLAQRVAAAAKDLTEAERTTYNSAMKDVVSRMQALQIRRIEEAVSFLASKNLKGDKLNKLLDEDAAKRGSMSFGDAVKWYQEVEKGTR